MSSKGDRRAVSDVEGRNVWCPRSSGTTGFKKKKMPHCGKHCSWVRSGGNGEVTSRFGDFKVTHDLDKSGFRGSVGATPEWNTEGGNDAPTSRRAIL